MKRLLLLSLAAVSLSACETPTTYAPATSAGAVGYSESAIEQGRWRVTFQGGSGVDPARVNDLVLLRAADLTLAQGYDWFRVTGRYGEGRGGAGGPVVSVGAGGASFGRGSAFGVGGGLGFNLGGGPSISRSLDILMGKGPTPREADVYDARDVRKSVGPRV